MENHELNESIEGENITSPESNEVKIDAELVEDVEDTAFEQLENELKDAKDKYVRLVAEFENFKKRKNKEISDLIRNAGEDVMKALLEVMDDYDRAQEQLTKSENVTALKEGIDLIFSKMLSTFKAKGLKEMEAKGLDFDADLHEAIAEIPAAAAEMEGKVLDVVQKGYFLNDKIIRHAKVVVAK
jgi:molecular chaperone GrpE